MKYAEIVFNIPLNQKFTYLQNDEFSAEPGMRVKTSFRNRKLIGMVIAAHNNKPEGDFLLKALDSLVDDEKLFGEAEIKLAEWIADMYHCSVGEALSVMLPGGKKESTVPALVADEDENFTTHTLAPQQTKAIGSFYESDKRNFYLYGITGSGKTEVYLQIAEKVLKSGRGVIYLVPEISLTHQLVKEVARRFKGKIAVIHSGITPSQKLAEWKRIKRGEALFVIGARSAVFAPVNNPGLFIIDEEHEGSYKSGSSPRYSARQVAMKRASLHDARCIMGSATPSVEAYYLLQEKIIDFSKMDKRLAGGTVPDVEVINMQGEKSCLSRKLVNEIKHTVEEGRQVILFLNRRGFSYFFHCRSCSFEMICRNCSVSLTYHKGRNRMVCHYCGFNQQPIEVCPDCGSLDVGYSGFGTELVEQEIHNTFPDYTIARIDTDSVKKKGSLQKILNDFKDRKYQILLGTQMVAKGLNFPYVKTVGIINADTGLHLPDFRAQERVFALILQVSGRAGRFFPDGKVFVQTCNPENDAVKLAASREIETFYTNELEIRKITGFPPYSRLIRFVLRGKNLNNVRSSAMAFTQILHKSRSEKGFNLEVIGPSECPISMISGNSRFQILLKSTQLKDILEITNYAKQVFKPLNGIYLEIDVDPVSLL